MLEPNGSSSFQDQEMEDYSLEIDEYEQINSEETIGKIISEISTSKKRRFSSDNHSNKSKLLKESSKSPNLVINSDLRASNRDKDINYNQTIKITKIEPVIFFKVNENPDKHKINLSRIRRASRQSKWNCTRTKSKLFR